jgi:hypothetical protein
MIGYIYKTTYLRENKIYVGKHEAEAFEPDKYIGSGKILAQVIKRQREESLALGENWRMHFRCELLEACETKEILNERERFWIQELDARNPEIGYNIALGGGPAYKGLKNIKRKRSKVVCIEENLTFNSITEAAAWCSGSVSVICTCCKGIIKHAYGYHWRYADKYQRKRTTNVMEKTKLDEIYRALHVRRRKCAKDSKPGRKS